MKNLLLTTTLVALTSTSAFANFNQTNNAFITGDSGTVEANGCKYGGQTDGVMTRGTGAQADTWLSTTAATIQVRTRGDTTLRVTSDNVLRTSDNTDTGVAVTMDYTGTGGMQTQALSRSGTGSVTSAAATITGITGPLSNLHVFYLGGTAAMSVDDDGTLGGNNPIHFIANDTSYKVNQIVTCTQ